MSKVYEALLYASEDRHEVIQAISIERPRSQPVVLSTLRPLRMEREMGQLHQRLAGLLPDPQQKVLQFISCRNLEGVSAITQEFARVLVEKHGKKVLLVDGDSKKLTQHHAFGIAPKISLQQIMSQGGNLDQAVTPVIHSRLFLAQLSRESPESVQRNGSNGKGDVWVHLRREFDMIVIDSVPIDTTDEGVELSGSVDGVVVVVEAEKTRSHVISSLQERIVQNGGKLLGVVFNKQHHYIPEWLYKRL